MTLRTLPPRAVEPAAHPILVDKDEARHILGGHTTDGRPRPVSAKHIERLIRAGELRAVGQGKARRITYASILAYIEREAGNGQAA